jgi:hypothetical protein
MKTPALASIVVLCIVSGCGIQKLSYFQVDPYAKPFHRNVKIPLNIVLLEDVRDSLIVGSEQVKKMTVTEFRRSVAASLKNTLGENFENVMILNEQPDTGLNLVVYRMRPFWKINGQSSSAYGTDGTTISTDKSFISAAFQFESSLFLANEKLQNSDLTVYSDDQMSTIGQAHPVFKSGLIKACETISREIFTDEVIAKLANL